MICCINCFNDEEIIAIIKTKKNEASECLLCGAKNVYIYDTESDDELEAYFEELLDIYSVLSDVEGTVLPGITTLLTKELTETWNIIDKEALDEKQAIELVMAICKKHYINNSKLYSEAIVVKELLDEEYLKENSILKCDGWEHFVKELTNNIRFHTDLINKEKFGEIIEKFTCNKRVILEKVYYRGRIYTERAFEKNELNAPPLEKSASGRINSEGIFCLYLADSKKTVEKEIRVEKHDRISIGKFKQNYEIKIIDLMGIHKISPFILENKTNYYINLRHLKKIAKELTKPVSKSGSRLEYLPTQYVADFIKSKGYKGVQYESTLNDNGYNLAIFDPEAFTCTEVENYKIDNIEIKSSKIK